MNYHYYPKSLNAYDTGYTAYQAGQGLDRNPYPLPSLAFAAWVEGWQTAETEAEQTDSPEQ